MEDDGFTLVSRKKSAKVKKKFRNAAVLNQSLSIFEGDFDSSLRKIRQCKEYLSKNTEVNDFVIYLKKCIESSHQNCPSIVCYGLGPISFCRIAQNQYSFLLLLKECWNSYVEAFDPIFSCVDKQLLNTFAVKTLVHNERAMKKITVGLVVFYMPHCDLFLYNNLLWANWTKENLPRIIIIGNSFSNIIENQMSKSLIIKYKYIFMAEKLCTEYSFPSLQKHLDVFNNMCAISFSKSSVLNADGSYWEHVDCPVYSDDEILFPES